MKEFELMFDDTSLRQSNEEEGDDPEAETEGEIF